MSLALAAGMRRIIFSGGEPMAYKNFWRVLEHAQGKFDLIVLSTNASYISRDDAARLKELVHYVDITVDGPRRQHNDIRGNYDKVIRGLSRVAEEEIPLSVICVFMRGSLSKPASNRDVIHYIAQTGDIFGAKKVKLLTTIPKGMSRNLFESLTSQDDIEQLHAMLQAEKERNGWTPRITIADWTRIGPGHAIQGVPIDVSSPSAAALVRAGLRPLVRDQSGAMISKPSKNPAKAARSRITNVSRAASLRRSASWAMASGWRSGVRCEMTR
jgi:Radical SAM superfamily/4Fe-4S single cluster domain